MFGLRGIEVFVIMTKFTLIMTNFYSFTGVFGIIIANPKKEEQLYDTKNPFWSRFSDSDNVESRQIRFV